MRTIRWRSCTLALTLTVVGCGKGGSVARLPEAQAAAPTPQAAPTPRAGAPAGGDEAASANSGAGVMTGATEAHRRSTITPRAAGSVARVHVREGDVVRAGQALVTLDEEDFALRLRQAEAGQQAARVQLEAARLDWERTRSLLADHSVPQSQFEAIDARFQTAKAAAAQADVLVDVARKAMRDSVVRAPFAGVVTRKYISEGEYAAVVPATQLVTIEEIDVLDLRLHVPASEGARVVVGVEVVVRFPATGAEVRAKVARVVPVLDPRTRTFAAIVEIPNADHVLRSGLFGEARLAK
ncbi:MAG: efflux RND transporter periplasmic adaptor subunit [Myxococcota bacterium]